MAALYSRGLALSVGRSSAKGRLLEKILARGREGRRLFPSQTSRSAYTPAVIRGAERSHFQVVAMVAVNVY